MLVSDTVTNRPLEFREVSMDLGLRAAQIGDNTPPRSPGFRAR